MFIVILNYVFTECTLTRRHTAIYAKTRTQYTRDRVRANFISSPYTSASAVCLVCITWHNVSVARALSEVNTRKRKHTHTHILEMCNIFAANRLYIHIHTTHQTRDSTVIIIT